MSQSMMGMCCRCLSEDVGRVPDALDVERLEAPPLGDPASFRAELHIRRSPPEI